jgi:hypothetical protein
MKPLSSWLLAVAPLLSVGGLLWVLAGVDHFEQTTGRKFYGLAAQHYSVPDWRMVYYPGGERIYLWVVTIPGITTAMGIISCGVALTVIRWRELRWFPLVGLWIYHALVLLFFGAAMAWVIVNITGVFI